MNYFTRQDIDKIVSALNARNFWSTMFFVVAVIVVFNMWSISSSLRRIADRIDGGTVYVRGDR